ncbi:unnamed protein product [Cuscuta epithymum]|uniref:Kinesin motor domain-containing protein n=2 Tax=Cuscuta epithymum TaxID=186058 RepID=A0AAV0D7X4_9ASTE|nr:unnamed protein product [Cuscuta epithymum]
MTMKRAVPINLFSHMKELLSFREAVESSAKQYSHSQNNSTLSAAVNFIDLAGSERASQTLSAGTRLKEGCHINRSLLTLGTVIRKLSKGRNGHIPYRDSKLTRILQNSLGGNARTAIICTMSPAHSHVEQSRNTLLFATCAKQVATKAKVNVVMSDKALVRQLQKELARLENELRALKSRSTDENSALVLKEKEGVIEKMDKEMRELMMQRDIAQSRMQSLLHSRSSWTEMSYQLENEFQTPEEYTASEASDTPFVQMEGPFSSSSSSSRFEEQRIVDDKAAIEEPFLSDDTSPRLFIDKYFGPDPCKNLQIPPTNHGSVHSFADSCKEVQCIEMDIDSTHSEGAKDEEVNNGSKAFTTESKSGANDDDDFLDVIVKEHKFKISMGDDVIAYEDVEAMPENQFCDDPNRAVPEEQVFDNEFPKDDLKTEALAEVVGNSEWSQEFERQRREIIELWDVCHMPLVHRTYFFLLFKGDPSDAVYMEVELRRLQFLKNSWSQGERIVKDGQIVTEAASIKGMKREREMLCRQMLKVLSGSERNKLFQKWGVGLNSKKRRLQLCNKLWKDSKDMDHLKQSASLVAKLVGIIGPNEASKAMFELNFSPQPINHLRSFSWAPRMAFMI